MLIVENADVELKYTAITRIDWVVICVVETVPGQIPKSKNFVKHTKIQSEI